MKKPILGVVGCIVVVPLAFVLGLLLLAGGVVAAVDPLSGLSLGGGSAPQCNAQMCELGTGPAPMFPWVPPGGFPDGYPYGQCTFGAAYNFDPFPAGHGGGPFHNLGDGGEWYATARSLGLPTLPPTQLPPYGAAASYRGATTAGHVAVVVADDANGSGYWVWEMNWVQPGKGTGIVDVRHVAFPGDGLLGSIPAPQASA